MTFIQYNYLNIILIIIGASILIYLSRFAYLTYDGLATWMDWANLIVSAIGSVALTIFIYWFGSVRAEELREKNRKITILNRLFGEYIHFSRKLIFVSNELYSIYSEASLLLSLINSNKLSQEQFSNAFDKCNKIPSSLMIFNLKEEDFSFLAIDNPNLYLDLIILRENLLNLNNALGHYENDIKKNLDFYRETLKSHGGRPLQGGLITDKEITTYFSRLEENIKNPILLTECCICCMNNVLKRSIIYITKKYKNEIDINCERVHKSCFEPIITYKYKMFDPNKAVTI